MELPGLSESVIREGATAESFRRGQEYYADGAVISLARRGNVIEAEVEGSQPEPYNVRVELDEGGVVDAACDCPYSWDGWCKHIVAVLLFCLDQPGEIEERQPLDQLLSGLSREQLQALLVDLAGETPRFATAIESRAAFLATASAPPIATSRGEPGPRRTPVDPKPFRRRVREALHSVDYGRGWSAYSEQITDAVHEVHRLLDQVWAFIRAGDGPNALAILEATTDEYLAGWESLDDSDGEASGLFSELRSAWAEAFLSTDLSSEERQAWAEKIEAWQGELEDYGLDEALDPALEAVEQGWDFAPLQRILREGITETEEPEAEGALWDDELVTARLNVLDRQGRHEEYLNLARAAGFHEQYAGMLVRLGRAEEAADYGLRHLETAGEALDMAKALREHGDLERALNVAEHGLSLGDGKGTLAAWLRDLAVGTGRPELALSAALVAVREEPSLAAYRRAQELAGEQWPSMRDEVLAGVRRARSLDADGAVEIFLHEGLSDDAIAVVDKTSYNYGLVERVVDAVAKSRPEWAIKACLAQAEPIMNEGRAQLYDAAAKWVGKSRRAFQAAGREAEWRAYVDSLLVRHSRKRNLVPLLRQLAA